jgi:hypothetical protein
MPKDPELRAHQEWLGYVQPVGLVVSPPALLAAQAHINKNIVPDHTRFLEWIEEVSPADGEDPLPAITDLVGLLQDVFGWEAADLIGSSDSEPLPESLEVTLPEYNETLRPTYAVKEVEPQNGNSPWLMLVQILKTGTDLDKVFEEDEVRWQASPQARFERLLRECNVPIGLLFNGTEFRLVYAPHGETSGYLTFPVRAMSEVSGRPIFAVEGTLRLSWLFTIPGSAASAWRHDCLVAPLGTRTPAGQPMAPPVACRYDPTTPPKDTLSPLAPDTTQIYALPLPRSGLVHHWLGTLVL